MHNNSVSRTLRACSLSVSFSFCWLSYAILFLMCLTVWNWMSDTVFIKLLPKPVWDLGGHLPCQKIYVCFYQKSWGTRSWNTWTASFVPLFSKGTGCLSWVAVPGPTYFWFMFSPWWSPLGTQPQVRPILPGELLTRITFPERLSKALLSILATSFRIHKCPPLKIIQVTMPF